MRAYLLGARSAGKTVTLDTIDKLHGNAKYIRQFSLVQKDEAAYKREFNNDVQRKRSRFVEEHLAGFKVVVNDIINVDLLANMQAVEAYVDTLLKSAEEADKKDAFSKMALFGESEFPVSEDPVLIALIGSVRQLIENIEYRPIIEKYVDIDALKGLACELIEVLWARTFTRKMKQLVNSLIRDVKDNLQMRTSAVQVDDVDLYRVAMEQRKVERFIDMVKYLQEEAIIADERVQGFRVVAKRSAFAGAGEIKEASGVKTAFRGAYEQYPEPYRYLQTLLANETLAPSELYKLFVKITYTILNKDGFEVSGGERSEYRLLQEIKDAQKYDILLIDEPESSFDNMFLQSDVNQLIREMSESMPVVVVTHNNTVGASIGADFVLYACKEKEDDGIRYRLYSGHPTDQRLFSPDGKSINNHEIMLNSLEAGHDTYKKRMRFYEATED